MVTLFSYDTPMSFGSGANHFSIHKTERNSFYFQSGTPQRPSKATFIELSKEQEQEITALKSCSENADYIKHNILGLA